VRAADSLPRSARSLAADARAVRPLEVMTWAAVLALLGVAVGGGLLADYLQLRSYWDRSCTGRAWKSDFPEASKAEIREFLEFAVRGMGFRRSRMFRFEPRDRVMEILSKRYPSYLSPDPLQVEDLIQLAKEKYGVDLAPEFHESITLGEIFERTRKRVA